jgi:hypothetical protein
MGKAASEKDGNTKETQSYQHKRKDKLNEYELNSNLETRGIKNKSGHHTGEPPNFDSKGSLSSTIGSEKKAKSTSLLLFILSKSNVSCSNSGGDPRSKRFVDSQCHVN